MELMCTWVEKMAIRAVNEIDLSMPFCQRLTWLLITIGGGAGSKAAHA